MRKIELEIIPYQSAGPVVFNRTRNENRRHIDTVPKTPAMTDGGMPGDDYEELGLYVIYDKYNRCAGVECFRPAVVNFDGKNLLRYTYRELYDLFSRYDGEIVEGPTEFTTYKFGLTVFDPDHLERPDDPCEWIAVFRKNYFNRKIGVVDPAVFSTFMIQPGFVESVGRENKTYETIADAFSDIFRFNKEYLVMLWNSLPVRFSYTTDIPAMAAGWIDMLGAVQSEEIGLYRQVMKSADVEASWNLSWTPERLKIAGEWKKVPGNYAEALNSFPEINMLREEFLYEWKMLLRQLSQAIDYSGCEISQTNEADLVDQLRSIKNGISKTGRFYRDETLRLRIDE